MARRTLPLGAYLTIAEPATDSLFSFGETGDLARPANVRGAWLSGMEAAKRARKG